MRNLNLALVLIGSGLLASTVALAHDGERSKKDTSVVQPTEMIRVLTPVKTQTKILGAVENNSQQTFVVRDASGITFQNHIVAESELPDVTSDVDVVDTYTFEYKGQTYTNKIVAD